ncbi:outer membrane protein assembly factor BamA [Thiovibrio sp. JS02]
MALPAEGEAGREYRLRFSGNQTLSEDRLRQAAAEELAGLTHTDYAAAMADDAAFQMELAYKREGYAFATVSYRFLPAAEDADLEFAVSEGPQVVVADVRLAGNTAFGNDELLAFFEGGKSGFLGLGKLLFVETEIRDALVAIRDLYLSEGYPQALVGEPVFSFSADSSRVTVQCTIHEGIRRTIAAVTFRGEPGPEAMGLLEDIPEELIGKPYVPRRKLLLRSRVREIYGNLGFPAAEVRVEEKTGLNFSEVELEVTIASGPRVTIAAIEIRGNERTSEAFIRDRLTLHPGDLYSAEGKQASFRRLYQTGLFSRVAIELGEGESDTGRVLAVTVQEAMARELFFQGGWGSYELLRGGAGYQNNNLFGSGRIFRLEAGGSVKSASLQANVTDPWLLGSDITADFPVYFRRREEPSFTREEMGASLLFSRDFFRNVAVTLGYLYRESNIVDIASESVTEVPESDYTTASAKLQATTDNRDDILFPSRGHKAFAAAEIADPSLGSGISFYRFNLGLRKFLPLSARNTLGLRFDSGLILPGRSQLTIPIGERFFNGGENTVRSFKEAQLGPKDAAGEPLGGDAFNVFALELRRRLTDRLAASVFLDYGNVSPNRTRDELGESPFNDRSEVIDATFSGYFKGFRPGLGCGLFYLLPVGPARLDFAWNPDRDKDRGEEEYVIHFSIGTAF